MEQLKKIKESLESVVIRYRKKINLFTSYFYDADERRQEELFTALQLNIKNKLFSSIYVLVEGREGREGFDPAEVALRLHKLEGAEKLHTIETDKRPTFYDFFMLANQYTDDETINILINSDIVIGEGFDFLSLEDKQAICLTRHDILSDGTYKILVGNDSHDCWIWKGKMIETVGKFFMGKLYCDGVLACQLFDNNYILKNPVHGMKIYHLHMSGVRHYCSHRSDVIFGHRLSVKHSNNDGVFQKGDMYHYGYNDINNT